ncbi:hypothetical protein [Angelakisella massiliensis]|uniref:hypothetical protein n=1 Tax=Angelakisella massiliensis TaxID=1871018 RepID=UPI00155E74F3|nr:hypothetical protein [Angelakisella massiliensis]
MESVLKTCEKLVNFPQGFSGKRRILAFSVLVGYNSPAQCEEKSRNRSFYDPENRIFDKMGKFCPMFDGGMNPWRNKCQKRNGKKAAAE